jgi:hypothetical protein
LSFCCPRGDIDNFLLVWRGLCQLKVWEGHCQLGGSLRRVLGLFPFIFDLRSLHDISLGFYFFLFLCGDNFSFPFFFWSAGYDNCEFFFLLFWYFTVDNI